MLSPFQIGMVVLFLASAWVSRHNWRGLLWLGVILTNYLVSSQWWRSMGGSPELAAGLYDAATVLLIYLFARLMWELAVGLIFTVSLASNLGYLAQGLAGVELVPDNVFKTLLEILNVVALSLIGGVSAFQRRGRTDGPAFRTRRTGFSVARSALAALSATQGRKDR